MKLSNIKQWKTSLIGCIILGAAIISVFYDKTWVDAMIGISAGVLFLFSPDKVIDNMIKFFNK